jgi:hypothetical protein
MTKKNSLKEKDYLSADAAVAGPKALHFATGWREHVKDAYSGRFLRVLQERLHYCKLQ